jgi:hypothetical protein
MLRFSNEEIKPQCPEHGDTMKKGTKEIRTGWILRKIMIVWECSIEQM